MPKPQKPRPSITEQLKAERIQQLLDWMDELGLSGIQRLPDWVNLTLLTPPDEAEREKVA